ncbi:MAG: DUF885 family protein, partial [Candidatus Berkiella sp.]
MNMPDNEQKLKLRNIANRYESELFNRNPELALFWGKQDVDHDRFMDRSLSALEKWHHFEDEILAQLNALKANQFKGSTEFLSYQLLKETIENEKQVRICRQELWNVNPMLGWQNISTIIAQKQPVGSPAFRAQALKRWKTFSNVTEVEIANLKYGLKEGYSAPKPVVQRVINQIAIMINAPVEETPFFDIAKRDNDANFKKEMAKIIESEVKPALKRYAYFLENEYLPQARDKVGISALSNGEQCYKASIKKETTLDIPAQAIYDYGQEHMLQIKREVGIIGQREFASQDIADVFRQAKQQTRNFFHSEKDILDYNLAALNRATTKASQWFENLPKLKGTIVPYPLHRAQTGASGEYHPPSDDGKHPGIFYINTFQPQSKSRLDQEATLFHELIPGHHYQI